MRKRRATALLSALALSGGLVSFSARGQTGAVASTYLPKNRKVLLTDFSRPLGDFPSIDMSQLGGPSGPFAARGYDWKILTNLAFNNSSSGLHFTVEQFQAELASGKYGVLFSAGHAGNAGIAVEHFDPSDPVAARNAIAARFRTLQSEGYTISDDGTTNGDVARFILGREMVIAVTAHFLADQMVKLGSDAVVMVGTCNSDIWFNHGSAFIAVGAGAFIGQPSVCYPDTDWSNNLAYWQRMLGSLPTPNIGQSNVAVDEAFKALSDAHGNLPGAAPTLAERLDSSVYKLRLYAAPKILRAQITHPGGGVVGVYSFIYPVFSYPFNQAPYPPDLSHAPMNAADVGPLEIALSFSQPMDTAWPGFSVTLSPTGGSTPLAFSSGKWVRNNTWTGSLNVPSDTSIRDGPATVTVTARDIYQTNNSAGGDLDNDGSGVAEGPNTMMSLQISRPTRFSIWTPSGVLVASNISMGSLPFNTLATEGTITVQAPNGIQSLNLTGALGTSIALTACNPPNPVGATSVTCHFSNVTPASIPGQ